MLEHLFSKCPVLPVDGSVSLAKYASTVSATVADASAFEISGDRERAALLFIRCMQLICKTIPSHPEYSVAENKSIVRDLARQADLCLARLEVYAAALESERGERGEGTPEYSPTPALPESVEAEDIPRTQEELLPNGLGKSSGTVHHESSLPIRGRPIVSRRLRMRGMHVSAALFSLFERISASNAKHDIETIGILAGRLTNGGKLAEESAVSATKENIVFETLETYIDMPHSGLRSPPLEITALIIPSQRPSISSCEEFDDSPGETELFYENDVISLLSAKGLTQLGWIRFRPRTESYEGLGPIGATLQARLQACLPEAASVVVTSNTSPSRQKWYALANADAVEAVLDNVVPSMSEENQSSSFDSTVSHRIKDKEGLLQIIRRDVVRVRHIIVRKDTDEAPLFKLYDLRPLAAMRAGKARNDKP